MESIELEKLNFIVPHDIADSANNHPWQSHSSKAGVLSMQGQAPAPPEHQPAHTGFFGLSPSSL